MLATPQFSRASLQINSYDPFLLPVSPDVARFWRARRARRADDFRFQFRPGHQNFRADCARWRANSRRVAARLERLLQLAARRQNHLHAGRSRGRPGGARHQNRWWRGAVASAIYFRFQLARRRVLPFDGARAQSRSGAARFRRARRHRSVENLLAGRALVWRRMANLVGRFSVARVQRRSQSRILHLYARQRQLRFGADQTRSALARRRSKRNPRPLSQWWPGQFIRANAFSPGFAKRLGGQWFAVAGRRTENKRRPEDRRPKRRRGVAHYGADGRKI